jgi:hypothetical protein
MTTRRIGIVALYLAAAGWNGQALAQPPASNQTGQKSPEQKFEKLLAQAQKAPAKTNWKALRTAFAATRCYQPYNGEWRQELVKVSEEIERGDLKAAEAMLVKLMERERFMRIDGHAVAMALYEKMGDSDKARRHRAFLEGLSSAVFIPGAGKSIEKPIEVLFLEEEYILVGSLGLRVKRQGLSLHNGHRFDVLTIEAKGDQPELDFYFNIDLPWGALDKNLGKVLDSVKKPASKQ